MLTAPGILLLLALAAPTHSENICSTQNPCALNTCDGAYTKFYDLISKCPGSMEGGVATGPFTPASCGIEACKAVITSIDDNARSSMKTGFSATGCENVVRNYGPLPPQLSYEYLKTLATQCGFSESIVPKTVSTAPETPYGVACNCQGLVLCSNCPLNTCSGAYSKFYDFVSKCPGSVEGGVATRTPASCGSDACKSVITSIDDNAMSSMKTGFSATGCEEMVRSYGSFPPELSYEPLTTTATQCGFAASIVKMTKVTPVVRTSFATHGAYVQDGFIHAVLSVVTVMVSSLGMEKY
jgi:hypothetical protein